MSNIEDREFRIDLPKHYKVKDPESYNNFPYGERLWTTIDGIVGGSTSTPFHDPEVRDVVRQRMVGYVVARLVAEARRIRRGFGPDEPMDGAESYLVEALDTMIERMLDVSEAQRNRISDDLRNILRRLDMDATRRRKEQAVKIGAAVRRYARSHSHRCYICATTLEYQPLEKARLELLDEEHQEKAKRKHKLREFEVEHIYPRAKGGSRGVDNLAACCNSCNKLKDDLTTFAEIQIETIMIASENLDRVKKAFGREQQFALFWRQKGRCGSCEEPLYSKDDERLFVIRKEAEQVYHFLNMQIICGECHDVGEYEGFKCRGD